MISKIIFAILCVIVISVYANERDKRHERERKYENCIQACLKK